MNKKTVSLLAFSFFIFSLSHAKTYTIVEYGAVSDTTVLSTNAVQKAIDICAQSGGGRVLVPTGFYKIGSIILRSNVNLHLEKGATLYGSTDLKDYIKMKPNYLSLRTQTTTIQLIYAENVENVTLDGYGTIDGCGHSFKKMESNDEGIIRPHLIRFITSRDITVKDITLKNSACWMQHYLACDKVYLNGLTIVNRSNYNNDAIDIDGCREVIISDIISDTDDDGITLKSTSPRLCENIVISNCIVSSRCNAIKLGTETTGGFRNIVINNCIVKPSYNPAPQFYGVSHGFSAIALEIVDGGILEDVNVSNIHIEGTESPIFIRLGNRARPYAEGKVVNNVGALKNIHLSNITVNHAGQTGSSITGLSGHPVENIFLSHITITQKGGCGKIAPPTDEKEKEYPEAIMWGNLPASGFFVNHVRNIVIRDIKVYTEEKDERPDFYFLDSFGIWNQEDMTKKNEGR
jgi:polygalacturonase